MQKIMTPKEKKKELRIKVWKKYKGKCAYCGEKITANDMHVDHIVPLHRGSSREELAEMGVVKGGYGFKNLNPSCPTCNMSKSTFTVDNWRRELHLKVERLRKNTSSFRLMEKYKCIKISYKPIIFYFERRVKNG